MKKANVTFFISLLTLLVLSNICIAESQKELKPDEIIFYSALWPYRTVTGTEHLVYKLWCLGFNTVKEFQTKHNLKVDNTIGPKTKRKIELEFDKYFKGFRNANQSNLQLNLKVYGDWKKPKANVSIHNIGETTVIIKGQLYINNSDEIEYHDFHLTGSGSIRVMKIIDGVKNYSVKPIKKKVLLKVLKNYTLKSNEVIEEKDIVLSTWENEDWQKYWQDPKKTHCWSSGPFRISLNYMDSAGKYHSLNSKIYLISNREGIKNIDL